jgi:hypothetical protein
MKNQILFLIVMGGFLSDIVVLGKQFLIFDSGSTTRKNQLIPKQTVAAKKQPHTRPLKEN